MPNIEIREEDRQRAELFLERYLTDRIPDGNFSPGSALRDHTITAVALVFAFFQKEIKNVRNATSLRLVANIDDDAEFTQAVENLVDNWFIRRKAGRRVRGTITLHFSQEHDGKIPSSVLFTKTSGVSFRLDTNDALFYAGSSMSPVVNAQGEVTAYTLRVPVIADRPGTAYEVPAGPFASVTSFSPFFLFAANETPFTGAKDPESPAELLARIPDALTKRDLGSNKAIAAVLTEEFANVSRVVVQGMGDPGMRRDLLELPGAYYRLHLGGHTDVYVSTPVRPKKVHEAEVGGVFVDPRTPVTIFTDATVEDWRNHVVEGDILRVYNAESSEPTRYRIGSVSKYYLRISERQTFPNVRPTRMRDGASFSAVRVTHATQVRCVNAQFNANDVGRYIRLFGSVEDNDGTYRITSVDAAEHTVTIAGATLNLEDSSSLRLSVYKEIVEYSIGDRSPGFANKIERRMTGEFTRNFREPGQVLLPAEPLYKIHEVSVRDPADPDADPLTGRVMFPVRKNTPPVEESGSNLSYQVQISTPSDAPSAQQHATLTVGFAPSQSGNRATIDTHPDGGVYTAPDAEFTLSDVGKQLRIVNASYPENRGEHVVAEWLSNTSVVLTKPSVSNWFPIPETRLSWELHHRNKYDGAMLRVVYDTVSQFDIIDAFIRSRENHIPDANTLAKAFHPVYLSFDIRYKQRSDVETVLDEAGAVQFLTQFINDFPETEVITVSDIVSEFYGQYKDSVSAVHLPLTIYYTLYAPDGRRIRYRTEDEVALGVANLQDPADVDRLTDPLSVGITERTVRYLTDTSLLTLARDNE